MDSISGLLQTMKLLITRAIPTPIRGLPLPMREAAIHHTTGKDDMSKIKLVAGKGEPQADKRINVWIEQKYGQGGSVDNELRIITQADGGKPKCIGTIKCDNDCMKIDILKFDFQLSIISRTYTYDNSSPAGEVWIKV